MRELLPSEIMNLIVDAIRDHCTVFDNIKVGERQLNKIGTKLYALNFIAVKMTVGDAPRIPSYTFSTPRYVDGQRVTPQYLAVSALLRDCEPKEIQDTGTYQALDAVRTRLALEIADAASIGTRA